MRRTLCVVVLPGLLLSTIVLAADTISIDSQNPSDPIFAAQQHINNAHQKLSTIASSRPRQKIEAVAFFANDRNLNQALEEVQNYGLEIKGFRHGTPDYSGGYLIKDGEPLDEAIENYKRDHAFFLQEDIKTTKQMIKNAGRDEEIKTALSARIRSVMQRQDDYAKVGVRVIGLELKGDASELNRLWDENSRVVRVIDVKEDGIPTPNRF